MEGLPSVIFIMYAVIIVMLLATQQLVWRRATQSEIGIKWQMKKDARSDWLICRAIFSCNARVLDHGKMTGKTSKRGRFESAQ